MRHEHKRWRKGKLPLHCFRYYNREFKERARRTKQTCIFVFTIGFVEKASTRIPSIHQQLIANDQKLVRPVNCVWRVEGEGRIRTLKTHAKCKAHDIYAVVAAMAFHANLITSVISQYYSG